MSGRFEDMDTLLREVANDWRDRCPAPPPLEQFLDEPLDRRPTGKAHGYPPRRLGTTLAVACAIVLVAGVISVVAVLSHPGGHHPPISRPPSPTGSTVGPSPAPDTSSPPRVPNQSRRVVRLTAAQIRAISHTRHPYLTRHCYGPIGAFPTALTTEVAGRRVLIATADCRNGTTGSPTDVAVYAPRNGQLRQLYLLDSGTPQHRGRLEITESYLTVNGTTATIHYGGQAPSSPVCCDTRSYHRVFHLGTHKATPGPLIRDHNRRILGPR